MNKITSTTTTTASCPAWAMRLLTIWLLSAAITSFFGCGTAKSPKKKDDFFTSGSREADQRAGQRMAKDEQLSGSGEGAGEKGSKQAVAAKTSADGQEAQGTNKAAQVEGKLALFDRLGGEAGIIAIVDDFTPRVLQDPRVDWQRKGEKSSVFSSHRKSSESEWSATDENATKL